MLAVLTLPWRTDVYQQGRAPATGKIASFSHRAAVKATASWAHVESKAIPSTTMDLCLPHWEKDLRAENASESVRKKQKIIFFGHFGSDNFGNEGTLQAIYFNLRRLMPEAEFACICTLPETAATIHSITALPISPAVITAWTPNNRITRLLRLVAFGIPSELYRWYEAFWTLKGTDALIVPGTGLLTDAFGLLSWGPYNMFKWSVLAKLRGCRLLFVSVGAGPLQGRLGRFFVKSALALADYRSYRDVSSLQYLKKIGFTRSNDRVYPDLAFSLPEFSIPPDGRVRRRRPVVGLGLMNSGSMYGDRTLSRETYRSYMETLVSLAVWLLDRGYDVRLLIGEVGDPVSEFRCLLAERLPAYDLSRIIETPITSVQGLLSQFADTDLVVATRFHNVLFALLSKKPTVSIAFHHKCTSLMNAIGLSEYCLPIERLTSDDLIKRVLDMEENSDRLKTLIGERAQSFRKILEEQYVYVTA